MTAFLRALAAFFKSLRLNTFLELSHPKSERTRAGKEGADQARSPAELDQQSTQQQDTDLQAAELQKEIRAGRKFTLAEAIGREGGSFMKGESSIPRPLRATTQINQFITEHSPDPSGPVSTTLCTWANNDIRVSRQLDTPLVALAQIIDSLLTEPSSFGELARQIAIAHSQQTGDRPYFQQLGKSPHPQAEHTHNSISTDLHQLKEKLAQSLTD